MSASKIVLRVLSISMSALSLILIVFLLYKAGFFAYHFGYRVFTEKAVAAEPGKDVTIEVKNNMSGLAIAELLEKNKLIKNKYLFFVQLRLSSYVSKLRPGIYTLNTALNAHEMMQIMTGEETDKGKEDTKESNR